MDSVSSGPTRLLRNENSFIKEVCAAHLEPKYHQLGAEQPIWRWLQPFIRSNHSYPSWWFEPSLCPFWWFRNLVSYQWYCYHPNSMHNINITERCDKLHVFCKADIYASRLFIQIWDQIAIFISASNLNVYSLTFFLAGFRFN